jgi:hypothetical protein
LIHQAGLAHTAVAQDDDLNDGWLARDQNKELAKPKAWRQTLSRTFFLEAMVESEEAGGAR